MSQPKKKKPQARRTDTAKDGQGVTAPVPSTVAPECSTVDLVKIAIAALPDAFRDGAKLGESRRALRVAKTFLEEAAEVLADPRTWKELAKEEMEFYGKMQEFRESQIAEREAELAARSKWLDLASIGDWLPYSDACEMAGYKTVREFRKALLRVGYGLADREDIDHISTGQVEHFKRLHTERLQEFAAERQRKRRKTREAKT